MSDKIDGARIYDPRDNQYKISDNPALVMADLAHRRQIITGWSFDVEFWKKIAALADFCDEKI